ncbi:hypothetical protein V8F33_012069 [Rhypophila sp. PSN 637]
MDVQSTTQAANPVDSKPTPIRPANAVDSKSTPTAMMEVQPTTQAANPVNSKSTPTPTGPSASPKPPSAPAGRSMSTALSVSSTPHSDRVRPLSKSATPDHQQRNVSGIFSFNGSPNTMPAANAGVGVGRPMGALAFRPNPYMPPNGPRNIPRGPTKQSPTRPGQGVGPGLPQAPRGPGQGVGRALQAPNRPSQGGSSGVAQAAARPGQGADPRPFSGRTVNGTRFNINGNRVDIGGGTVTRLNIDGNGIDIDGTRFNMDGNRINVVGAQGHDALYSGLTPTAVLSRECQRRHFNPEWKVYSTEGGRFGCDVKVGNTWIRGKTTWKDIIAAKYAMAREALPAVRRMPVISSWAGVPMTISGPGNQSDMAIKQEQGAGNNSRSIPQVIKREDNVSNNTGRAQTAVKQQPGQSLYTPPTRREQNGNQGTKATMLNNISVESSLMTHLQHSLRVSIPSNSNPEVTKAFLEGVALGSRLGASLDGVTRGRRGNSRSRSPAAAGSRRGADRYRVRSPPPNARPRSTPPPVYADYPGRPNSDHYRPNDSAIPRERPRAAVTQPPSRPALVGNTGIDGESWGHDGYYRMNRIKSERQD